MAQRSCNKNADPDPSGKQTGHAREVKMGAKKTKKNLKSRTPTVTTKASQKLKASALEAKAIAIEAAQKVTSTFAENVAPVQEKVQALQTPVFKTATAAEHLNSLRTRFDQMKKTDISEKITIRIQGFRERAVTFAKNIYQKGFQKDGIQKLILTTGLGIATLVAAGIAEDRGRQVQSLKAAVSAQRMANQQLAQQVSQTQADIDEKNLRLMVAEQAQREEQLKMEQQLERAKLEIGKAKSSNKSIAKSKKRSKKTMVASKKKNGPLYARSQKNTKAKLTKRSDLKVSKAE